MVSVKITNKKQGDVKLSVDNHDKSAVPYYNIAKQFPRMCKHFPGLANFTNKFLFIYSKLYSVSDGSQQRVVRLNMLTIFKLAMRHFLVQNASGSHQGGSLVSTTI